MLCCILADEIDGVQFIANKTKTALESGLGVILCVGETLEVSLSSALADISHAKTEVATRKQQDHGRRHYPAKGCR